MATPRSIRFESGTVDKLARYTARHPGMTQSSAAALLVEEALRMEDHPGVVFRDGPAGRRPALMAGPDVWEVVRAIRDVRAAEPKASADEVIEVVCDVASLTRPVVQVAVSYYGELPEEINAMIEAADDAEADAQRQLSAAQHLLEPPARRQ